MHQVNIYFVLFSTVFNNLSIDALKLTKEYSH